MLWLGLLMYLWIGYMDIDNSAHIFPEDVIYSALVFAFFSSCLLFISFLVFWSIIRGGLDTAAGLPPAGMPLPDLSAQSGWLKPLFLALLLASGISLILIYGLNTFQETWEERRVIDRSLQLCRGCLQKRWRYSRECFCWCGKEYGQCLAPLRPFFYRLYLALG